MGSGIAEVCARAGLDVVVREVSAERVSDAEGRIARSLDRGVSSGKVSDAARREAIERVTLTTSLDDLSECQMLIEAVVEDEKAKLEVFAALDAVVTDPRAVLASNTSSIPIMTLAMATSRPERVIGIHFFNPVPVLKLVELVTSLLTSEQTGRTARTFVTERLGKKVIASQDRAGFVVNALLIPYILSAVGCSSLDSPRRRTSTPAWLKDVPIRWVRWLSPI